MCIRASSAESRNCPKVIIMSDILPMLYLDDSLRRAELDAFVAANVVFSYGPFVIWAVG